MRQQGTPGVQVLVPSPSGVIVAEGWGTRLFVQHGLLILEDEQGQDPGRRAVIPRARAKGLRIVLLGRAGTISVEALRWIADAGATFALIDAAAGRIVCSSAAVGLDDARLRRAQALAGVPPSPIGLEVARYLIGSKIAGHLSVLERSFGDRPDEAGSLREVLSGKITKAPSVEALVSLESACAATYWSCWPDVEIRFARKDEVRVPGHWKRFGTRASALTGGPRLATSPGNAAANYLTALGELEARASLLALGADSGLGVVHLDAPNRDSFALDLLEVLRPELEAFLLELLAERVFAKSDFYETQRGVFRVGATLARHLADTLPRWRRLVAPHAEHVVGLIASSSPRPLRLPTKLTQSRRVEGRDPYRRKEAQRARTRERVAGRMVPKACRMCGSVLPSGGRGRTYCDDCLLDARREEFDRARAKATAALEALRRQGSDPSHGGEAATKRARTLARRREEAKAFEATADELPPREVFIREILPTLQVIGVRAMAEATGLTRSYCSMIRKGRVPHARHWPALAALASEAPCKK